MAHSFVTGATGFLGRHLLERLMKRGGTISILVREDRIAAHAERITQFELTARSHGTALRVVPGDVTLPGLGVDLDPSALDHVFHVAGLYDLSADPEALRRVNIEGTKNVLAWLANDFRGVLH